MDAHILVAGAGPVGTSLAIDAALRGVRVIVIEARAANAPADARCNTIAARTMETFRRFGIAEEVRAAGLPDDYPTDTLFATSLAGPELTRIPMPSSAERSADGFLDSDWPSPERMVRESQLWLEPILRRKLLSIPGVTFLPDTELVDYDQDEDGVTVRCRDLAGGRDVEYRVEYLAGCDGGSSRVRKTMGAKLDGDAEISRTRSSLVRSGEIRGLFGRRRPAWMTWVANHKVRGNVVAIDGEDLWLIHRALPDGVTDFDALDADQSIRDVLGVGADFSYELVHHQDWVGRRLVADRLRDRRVFLAGDAAHLWVPFGGYGMNAGIADAMNLSWLLSSVINDWAAPDIIDAYEAERLPITAQVSRFAMAKLEENAAALASHNIPKVLSASNVFGWAVRDRLGKRLYDINVPQMVPEGLNFGYYYTRSPIIIADGEQAPDYDMGHHQPSTVPGCRIPNFTVGGRSIIDMLGPDYTLVRFDTAIEVTSLVETGLPLTIVDAARPRTDEFRHVLVMVRADSHVVWRGDALPRDLEAFAQRLRGVQDARVQASA